MSSAWPFFLVRAVGYVCRQLLCSQDDAIARSIRDDNDRLRALLPGPQDDVVPVDGLFRHWDNLANIMT